MENKKLEEAINRVYEKLSKLSPEEFAREVEKHEDGDIALILLETNALESRVMESRAFDEYFLPPANTINLRKISSHSDDYSVVRTLFDPSKYVSSQVHIMWDEVPLLSQLPLFDTNVPFLVASTVKFNNALSLYISRHIRASYEGTPANTEEELLIAA